MKNGVLKLFDYAALDPETRISVHRSTNAIRECLTDLDRIAQELECSTEDLIGVICDFLLEEGEFKP